MPSDFIIQNAAFTLLPALLLILAGLGWRKLARRLSVGLLVIGGGTALAGWLTIEWVMHVSSRHDSWRGLTALVDGLIAAALAALVLIVGAIILLVRKWKTSVERAPRSRALLRGGFCALLVGGVCLAHVLVVHQPRLVSDARLLREYAGAATPAVEEEFARRGPTAAAVVIARLRQFPIAPAAPLNPNEPSPFLHLLGRLGGPDARAELTRWSAPEVPAGLRFDALAARAEIGDTDAAPIIGALLTAGTETEWEWRRAQLYRALGQLRATGQISALRAALLPDPSPFAREAAITALIAIDTDEAWAVIDEGLADPDAPRRSAALEILAQHPCPRAQARLDAAK